MRTVSFGRPETTRVVLRQIHVTRFADRSIPRMSTLPADYPTCPIRRARPSTGPRPDDESAIRGVLHDVGHALFTLSLLIDSAEDTLLPRLGSDVFELVEAEMARLLAMVHSGTRRCAYRATAGRRTLLEPFAVVARRTTLTKVWVRPGPEIAVRTDPGMVWRVVANLIDNAVRAAGPLGNVEIVAAVFEGGYYAESGGTATIDVIDDGPGFQRGPSGLANLGLTVVNGLLDACGGRLLIDEVHPQGTRMRVILPVSGSTGAEPRASALIAGGRADRG